CRCRTRTSTYWWSTSRPPRRWASKFQTSCWPLPTRSSNDREDETARLYHAHRRRGGVAARGAQQPAQIRRVGMLHLSSSAGRKAAASVSTIASRQRALSRARQQRKMRDGYFATSAPALATWPS